MAYFEPKFTDADIDADMDSIFSGIEEDSAGALIETMHLLVDAARAKTRAENGFNNITWNLRESIGGVVVLNHAIVDTYFPHIGKGPEGRAKGIAFAQEVALLQATDHQLLAIIVAGEDYASVVEALDRDVISHVVGDNFESQFLKFTK